MKKSEYLLLNDTFRSTLYANKEVLLQDEVVDEYLPLNKTFRSSPNQQGGTKKTKKTRRYFDVRWHPSTHYQPDMSTTTAMVSPRDSRRMHATRPIRTAMNDVPTFPNDQYTTVRDTNEGRTPERVLQI